jgi:hypothetical protein
MVLTFFEICYLTRSSVKLTPQLWKVNIRVTLEDSASLRVANLVSGDGILKSFTRIGQQTTNLITFILADLDCRVVKLIWELYFPTQST